MNNSNVNGIAIRISDRNSYGMSPKSVINEHFKFSKLHNSPVYFSTNIHQDQRFNKQLEEMILFFRDNQQIKFVKAKIINIISSKAPFLPTDAEKYSPAVFSQDGRCSWYLIDDMKEVADEDLKNYFYHNNNSLELELLSDAVKRPRFPKCYFEFESSKDDEYTLV